MSTPEDILAACRSSGKAGRFSVSEQAQNRAGMEGHSPADLRHALAEAIRCELADGRWIVRGPSLDGTQVTLSVVLEGGTLSVV
jgi:hypothetical protein